MLAVAAYNVKATSSASAISAPAERELNRGHRLTCESTMSRSHLQPACAVHQRSVSKVKFLNINQNELVPVSASNLARRVKLDAKLKILSCDVSALLLMNKFLVLQNV